MDATAEELESLRARAYGPEADIHDDPAAMQRLHELEQWSRQASSVDEGAAESPPLDDAAAMGSTDDTVIDDGGGAASDSPVDEAKEPSHSRVSKRVQVVWALSLVLVAAIAATVTSALVAVVPVTTATGARQIATLLPQEDYEWPEVFFGADADGLAFEYLGMRVLGSNLGYFTTGSGECLTVFDETKLDEENGSFDGQMYSGCAAGTFPATVQFVVDDSLPEELRAEFAPGTALQFVLDGDRVGVFTAPD